MTTLYTVARRDGGDRRYNLTLREAAEAILLHDGGEYEICDSINKVIVPDEKYRLWYKKSADLHIYPQNYFSFEADRSTAEADIFAQIVEASRQPNWEGHVVDKQNAITLTLTERERDTILAALRFWQREGLQSDGIEREIAENGRTGDDAALTADEIDDLCERINI